MKNINKNFNIYISVVVLLLIVSNKTYAQTKYYNEVQTKTKSQLNTNPDVGFAPYWRTLYMWNNYGFGSLIFNENNPDRHNLLTLVAPEGFFGIGDSTPTSRLTVGNAPDNGPQYNIRSYSEGTTNWQGAGAFGGAHANVVLGQLENKAYIGAHNGALNAWADLIINADAGNVGVGKSPETNHKLDVDGVVNATGFKINGVDFTSTWTKSGNNLTSTTGNVGIGDSTPTSKLTVGNAPDDGSQYNIRSYSEGTTNWQGAGAFGGASANVVLGQHMNKATIGAHNSTLNAWADLLINAGGGKVGIGIGNSNPTKLLEIGQDNGIETVSMLKVHGGATFNNNAASALNQTTQVSINTNKKVQNAALTVAGTTFIGSWDEIDTLEDVAATTDPDDVKGMNTDHYSDYNLWVTKGVVSEDFAITDKANWADYVFKEEYQLPLLSEVATFIKENKHLPGVVSEKEVQEKGYTLHNMNVTFLEKIENLYLYSIQQEEKIKKQEDKITSMEKDIALLKAAMLLNNK